MAHESIPMGLWIAMGVGFVVAVVFLVVGILGAGNPADIAPKHEEITEKQRERANSPSAENVPASPRGEK